MQKMIQKIIYKYTIEEYDVFSAKFISDCIKQKLSISKLPITIALSGGTTPLPILRILKEASIDWTRVSFYMVDERCVKLNDPSCNYSNIYNEFLKFIPSKSFSMISSSSYFEKDVANYNELLDVNLSKNNLGVPQFDLILLGMGEDGHTASLFPNTDALFEMSKKVVLNEVPQLGTQRITLTYPIILASKAVLVLCKGGKKEEIINEINTNKGVSYPITKIVKGHANFKWLIA
jgi:6-phosphogluconolactonase